MNNKYIAVAFFAISSFTGCTVLTPAVERIEYNEYSDNKTFANWDGNGVVYALPQTSFEVLFEIGKTVFKDPMCKKGMVSNELYTAIGLDSNKPILGERTAFTISSSELTARPIPDPNKFFISRFPESSMFADSSLIISTTEGGLIESVDGSSNSKSVEIATNVISLGLNLAKSFVGLGLSKDSTADQQKRESACTERAGDIITLNTMLKRYRGESVPFPKETVEKYESELAVELAKAMAFFVGESTVTKGQAACSVTPDEDGEFTLFEYNAMKGFSKIADECVFSSDAFKASTILGDKKDIIKLVVSPPTQLNNSISKVFDNKTTKSVPKIAGFYYNIPKQARVRVIGHDKATTKMQTFTMPQLGSLAWLDRFKGNNPALIVTLHPNSGTLKSVKVTDNAANYSGLLDTVSTGSSAYIDQRAAQKEKIAAAQLAEAAKGDELTVLMGEKNLLETKLAILVASDALKALADAAVTP